MKLFQVIVSSKGAAVGAEMSRSDKPVTMSSPDMSVTMSSTDMSATMSPSHVDVTMSSPNVDVKTTMTSPKSDEDIETSVALTKTSPSSKTQVFETLFSLFSCTFFSENCYSKSIRLDVQCSVIATIITFE